MMNSTSRFEVAMRRYLIALALAVAPIAAVAQCVTNSAWIGGRYVICTTCCSGSHCHTTCL
jgi:hypothetical protein